MSLRYPLSILSVVCISALILRSAGGQGDSSQPIPAAPAILAAFDRTPIVAIGELHSLQAAGDFYVSLINTPGFADKVNDIVVEFSTPLYQDVLDRYVNGEDVPPSELANALRNTTKVFAWESPIYPQLLTAVRNLNRTLPRTQAPRPRR